MVLETIKVKDKKGNFLNLLRGLFKIIHYKGKDLSFIIADNLLILQKELDGLIFDDPSEDYKLLVMKAQEIAKSEDDDAQDRVKQLEDMLLVGDLKTKNNNCSLNNNNSLLLGIF